MTHASVFSGIGGPEVAATMLGWENLFHCEINPFGRRVLDYWYPNSKSYEDITTTDFTEWRGRVNVLTGGFPCQPFSYAGKRGGAQDDRYLWPYMFRCIDQIRPDWVVAENVAGILTMVEQGEVSEVASAPALFDSFDRVRRYQLRETFTLQRICDDLEGHGYAVQPVLVPACGVGAPHRRDRVFIIGHRVDDDTREDATIRQSQRTVCDTADERPGRPSDGCTTGEVRGEVREEGNHAELRVSAETSSRDGLVTDSEHLRLQHDAIRGEQAEDIGTESIRRQDRLSESIQRIAPNGEGGETSESAAAVCGERWRCFPTQSPVHRGNDGLPFDVDRLTISFGKWRTEALKAYGNAIVPQVMYEIFRAIQQVEQDL